MILGIRLIVHGGTIQKKPKRNSSMQYGRKRLVTITPEQVDKMMMDNDENHDGMINYEEFVLIMTK